MPAAAAITDDDMVRVTFEVTLIERVRRGATLAIATVELEIAGVVQNRT